jgi:hypothetical protein
MNSCMWIYHLSNLWFQNDKSRSYSHDLKYKIQGHGNAQGFAHHGTYVHSNTVIIDLVTYTMLTVAGILIIKLVDYTC